MSLQKTLRVECVRVGWTLEIPLFQCPTGKDQRSEASHEGHTAAQDQILDQRFEWFFHSSRNYQNLPFHRTWPIIPSTIRYLVLQWVVCWVLRI